MAGATVFQNLYSDPVPTRYRMYFIRTRVGVFSIVQRDNRWRLIFDGDTLGSYFTAEQAVGDLASGHFSPRSDIDPATLGIPADLSKWEQTRL